MPMRLLAGTPIPLEQEVDIGGEIITQVVGDVRCVESIDDTDATKRILLYEWDGITLSEFIWAGDVETFDENNVELDPDLEPLWEVRVYG
jgi:hypothetical protein